MGHPPPPVRIRSDFDRHPPSAKCECNNWILSLMCEIRFPTNANWCGVKEMGNQENEKRSTKIQQLKLTF